MGTKHETRVGWAAGHGFVPIHVEGTFCPMREVAGREPSSRLIYRHLLPRAAMLPALKSKARKALGLCAV